MTYESIGFKKFFGLMEKEEKIEAKKRAEELPTLRVISRICKAYYFMEFNLGMSPRAITLEEFKTVELRRKSFRYLFDRIGRFIFLFMEGHNPFDPDGNSLVSVAKHLKMSSDGWEHYPPSFRILLGEILKEENTKLADPVGVVDILVELDELEIWVDKSLKLCNTPQKVLAE